VLAPGAPKTPVIPCAMQVDITHEGQTLIWYDFKGQLVYAIGTSNNALHLPLGHLAPPWALLPVVALQGVNEFLDARDCWYWTGTVRWSEAWTDTLATLALPTANVLNFRRPLVEAMIADGHSVKTNAPDPAWTFSPQLESAQ